MWRSDQTIVYREICRGRPWSGGVVYVVEDEPELLVTYRPEGTPFGFPDGDWPTANGLHPWHGRGGWEGHGPLMLQRPGESYSVWHFWEGHDRVFAGWYLNIQEPFRRTAIGYDTQDLELDVWIPADGNGSWSFRDDEALAEHVRLGRYTSKEVRAIRAEGARIGSMLDAGERWWDESWSRWQPRPEWTPQPLPEGWDVV